MKNQQEYLLRNDIHAESDSCQTVDFLRVFAQICCQASGLLKRHLVRSKKADRNELLYTVLIRVKEFNQIRISVRSEGKTEGRAYYLASELP